MTHRCTRAEMETICRWAADEDTATLWTAHPATARKWERLGYPVVRETGGWASQVPIRAVSFRRLTSLAPRRPRRGQFGAKPPLPPKDEHTG